MQAAATNWTAGLHSCGQEGSFQSRCRVAAQRIFSRHNSAAKQPHLSYFQAMHVHVVARLHINSHSCSQKGWGGGRCLLTKSEGTTWNCVHSKWAYFTVSTIAHSDCIEPIHLRGVTDASSQAGCNHWQWPQHCTCAHTWCLTMYQAPTRGTACATFITPCPADQSTWRQKCVASGHDRRGLECWLQKNPIP